MTLTLADATRIADEYGKSAGARWFEDRQAIDRSTYWYLPIGFVGSVGIVVCKSSARITVLGSTFQLDDWFWGYERGFVQDSVTLRVLAVRDVESTLRVLNGSIRASFRRDYERRAWLTAQLQNPPVDFSEQSLAHNIPAFRQAENERWFQFAVLARDESAG